MIKLAKIKQESVSLQDDLPPTIVHISNPFLIFQILPPPLGKVIKIHFPLLKRGIRDGGGSPNSECALEYRPPNKNTKPSFSSGPT